jgi:hypothetical protein
MKSRVLLLFALGAACSSPRLYPPETKRVEVRETLHGVDFVDPYRLLEDPEPRDPNTR